MTPKKAALDEWLFYCYTDVSYSQTHFDYN